eukprot:1494456-Prymnesium_polylepis.1
MHAKLKVLPDESETSDQRSESCLGEQGVARLEAAVRTRLCDVLPAVEHGARLDGEETGDL